MQARLRRGASGASASASLPITNKDVQAGLLGKQNQRRRELRLPFSPYDRTSAVRWIALIILAMSIASFIQKPILSILGLRTKSATDDARHLSKGRSSLPLSQFSELSFALQHSDLVALYFAASWCPMSTPVSIALDEAFGKSKSDMILSPEGGKATLAIVYVSSDESMQEYEGYIDGRNWLAIPFTSSQRNVLKVHFSVCAHRELERLGIDRKHEIPTIIVIDSQTQGIITTSGADDIDEMGSRALDHWKDMQRWIRKQSSSIA